jgi:glycosyltransferase involved in cell wall biosynthesis
MSQPPESTPDAPQSPLEERALELRTEIDRLRLQNQHLTAQLEELTTPARWGRAYSKHLWRSAWQKYWVARWHLLHVRDPKRALKVRDQHEPYKVRVPQVAGSVRPRVLHVIGNFHTGGSAQLIVDIVEQLGQRFESHILVRSLPPRPAYTGIDLIHRERVKAKHVLALLQELKPDLVHVHMLGHQHDEYGKRDWTWYHRVFVALEAYGCPVIENINIPVEPYVSPAVRCYVHVSDFVRERFGRQDAWNLTIYPGSDFEFYARRDDQAITDGCIGMVYRMQPDKLDESSIEPFIRAIQKRPGTRALIVGGGQLLQVYQQRVAEAGLDGAFTFTGFVPYVELPGYLAKMSVFVAPVHTESFGQVSAFAMGMELPVVAYRVGALVEITGDPSVLAPPGDANRLAEIVVELLDDRPRRLRIGEANRRRAEERFSTASMVADYDALYSELRAPAANAVRPLDQRTGFHRLAADRKAQGPAVSVLMAVFNGEAYLREAIQSILSQTLTDFEFLIVDDGSTDSSRAIVESFDDPRIRLIRNAGNVGLSRSLNRGIAEARGRYLSRMDADDISEPQRLQRQVAFMEGHPDAVVTGCWNTVIDRDGREIARRRGPIDDVSIRWTLQFCSPFAHSAATIRMSALRELHPVYDESLVYAMDYDLWVRLAALGPLANINAFLVRWRTSPGSMTSRLGDKTERLDRVTAMLAPRLGWPLADVAENERKADLMCAIVAGATPDCSVEDAQTAVRNLFRLHDDFCRQRKLDPESEKCLREELTRHTARGLQWLGHRYPDKKDHRYARKALVAACRVSPRSLFNWTGASLAVKVVGGGPLTAVARRLSKG